MECRSRHVLNNSGQIVGDTNLTYEFVNNGSITTLPSGVEGFGLNDDVQIVGSGAGSGSTTVGEILSPPVVPPY